jgi:hypothetical protein
MKRTLRFPLVALLGLIVYCSTMKVNIDYDQDANFLQYKTYRWIANKPALKPPRPVDHALLEKRIKKTVDDELAAKGYVLAEGAKPDFLITFHIGAQNKVDVTHYGYRYGPRGRWWGHQVEVHRYKEGTLLIDIVDPETEQLVWRGSAVDAIRRPQDLDDTLYEAVQKIMAKFPPQ